MADPIDPKTEKILEETSTEELDIENPFRRKDPSQEKFSNRNLGKDVTSTGASFPAEKNPEPYNPNWKDVNKFGNRPSWQDTHGERVSNAQVAGSADRASAEGDPAGNQGPK